MNHLTRQFLCCTPIDRIDFTISGNDNEDFSLQLQKQILDNTINSDLIKRYPMRTSYQRAFLRLLMKKIKESGNETHDELYIAYCNSMSSSDNESVHYRHFLIENGMLDLITLQESVNLISKGTTGLCSWQGAVVLSKWCAENKEQFHGKTILELGCGVGLTGISVVSACSPKQYIFSDCHQSVLQMLCENLKHNFSEIKNHDIPDTSARLQLQLKYEQTNIQVIELKWEDIDKYIIKYSLQPDVVIAADILYDSDSFSSLIAGLKHLLVSNCYAIIAVTVRNVDTVSQFLEQLGDHELAFEEYTPPKTVSIQSINSIVRILKIFKRS